MAPANPTQMPQPGIAPGAPVQPQRPPGPAPQNFAQPTPAAGLGVPQPNMGNPNMKPPQAPQPAPQQRPPAQAAPPAARQAAPQGGPPPQPQAVPNQGPTQAVNIPQGNMQPQPVAQRPPMSQANATTGALLFQNIAKQLGDQLKVQLNASIDDFVKKFGENMQKSLSGIPNQAAVMQNMQMQNSAPATPPQGQPGKKQGFFAKRKAAKAAKKAAKQAAIAAGGKKAGCFSKFGKKKAAAQAQQPAPQAPQQPLYPPPATPPAGQARQPYPAPQQPVVPQQPMAPGQMPLRPRQ